MFGVEKSDPKTLSAHKLDGKKLYVGIVQARFNEDITISLSLVRWKYPPHCKLWLKKTLTMP